MVYLLDFEDSFTLNIYCELKELGLEVKLIELARAKDFLEEKVSSEGTLALVLGPGPGHPDEYGQVLAPLRHLLRREQTFIMGICLGHQLVARALDMKVLRSTRPCHGQVESIQLTPRQKAAIGIGRSELNVQRYNSLAVPVSGNKAILEKKVKEFVAGFGEVQIMRGESFLTYQFHPESVGTSFRKSFFRPLQAFLL